MKGTVRVRASGAAAAIRRESGQELVRFLQADHATVGGNQQLADQVRATFPCLNILVNNVGGLYQRRWETPTATKPSTLSRLGRS